MQCTRVEVRRVVGRGAGGEAGQQAVTMLEREASVALTFIEREKERQREGEGERQRDRQRDREKGSEREGKRARESEREGVWYL